MMLFYLTSLHRAPVRFLSTSSHPRQFTRSYAPSIKMTSNFQLLRRTLQKLSNSYQISGFFGYNSEYQEHLRAAVAYPRRSFSFRISNGGVGAARGFKTFRVVACFSFGGIEGAQNNVVLTWWFIQCYIIHLVYVKKLMGISNSDHQQRGPVSWHNDIIVICDSNIRRPNDFSSAVLSCSLAINWQFEFRTMEQHVQTQATRT